MNDEWFDQQKNKIKKEFNYAIDNEMCEIKLIKIQIFLKNYPKYPHPDRKQEIDTIIDNLLEKIKVKLRSFNLISLN